jgi:hypothetical protein
MPISMNDTSARSTTPAADRRTRLRLRDLCDEVIASYRLAAGRDVLSDAERSEARATLARVAPAISR